VRTGGGRTVEYPGVPDDIGQPRKGSAMPARPKLKKNNKRKMQKMSRKKNRRKK
jgi:hypothetical protein